MYFLGTGFELVWESNLQRKSSETSSVFGNLTEKISNLDSDVNQTSGELLKGCPFIISYARVVFKDARVLFWFKVLQMEKPN